MKPFVAKELGYDRIYGLALVMLAADIGFAAATTNPFTVQIAQGIAEVPLGSGISLRIVFFVVCMSWTIIYVLRYGARIKKDPSRSVMAPLKIGFRRARENVCSVSGRPSGWRRPMLVTSLRTVLEGMPSAMLSNTR